jgi:hypothetical protein
MLLTIPQLPFSAKSYPRSLTYREQSCLKEREYLRLLESEESREIIFGETCQLLSNRYIWKSY